MASLLSLLRRKEDVASSKQVDWESCVIVDSFLRCLLFFFVAFERIVENVDLLFFNKLGLEDMDTGCTMVLSIGVNETERCLCRACWGSS